MSSKKWPGSHERRSQTASRQKLVQGQPMYKKHDKFCVRQPLKATPLERMPGT